MSDEALRLVNMCINANDIQTVSALSIFRDAIKWREVGYTDPKDFNQYGAAQYRPIYLTEGGQRLPEAMAAALSRPVEFNRDVRSISYAKDTVELRCLDGSKCRARRVVVAAPIMTLRTIEFSPPLPGLLHEAIQTARASANTGFFLRAKRPFWEEDGLPVSTWTDTIFERLLGTPGEEGNEIMRIWINGDNAERVDRLGASANELLLETLGRVRPSTRGAVEVIGRISWGSDPLIGGEKYVMGPGQVSRYGKIISEPVGPIHWVGEHHKSRDQGAEAALQSGERAAAELLVELRPQLTDQPA